MNAVLFSLATFFSTSVGGLCAFGLRERLHLALALTIGVLLGVVCFDLLPESFALARQAGFGAHAPLVALALGLLLFHALNKLVRSGSGMAPAFALVAHSAMDGVGLGLGFAVSPEVGLAVAAAVIAHDFCDGMNTVGLMLAHRRSTKLALLMLALDAVAPILGAASVLKLSVPPVASMAVLGFFAGVLLQIALCDVLPRAMRASRAQLVALPALGGTLVFVATRLATA